MEKIFVDINIDENCTVTELFSALENKISTRIKIPRICWKVNESSYLNVSLAVERPSSIVLQNKRVQLHLATVVFPNIP